MTARLTRRLSVLSAIAGVVCLAILPGGPSRIAVAQPGPVPGAPLRIVVMDPLALPLSCACVEGHGQKDYGALGAFLQQQLGRPVDVSYAESLVAAHRQGGREIDAIIGKRSVVLHDARKTETVVRPLLALTDRFGLQTDSGEILVRMDDPAKSLEDLAGRKLALGPVEDDDCHAAVRDLLKSDPVLSTVQTQTSGSIEEAVFALTDGDVDAAVVPDFLPVLLVGCGKVLPNSIRPVAHTGLVPFVQVFATARLSPDEESRLRVALLQVAADPQLLTALESKAGFAEIEGAEGDPVAEWTDWRGPDRSGRSRSIPRSLPEQLTPLWRAEVTGPALAGIAATQRFVVVADKDAELVHDVFRCFDATNGKPLWTLEYEAAEDIDYTNAPRATPVIHDGLVYLQGAWGHLHCVRLESGEVVWRRNILKDFGAEPVAWGCSVPPLVVDDKLIVMPGARQASIVALSRTTGDVLWQTPGHAAAYAPAIVAVFSGKRQIVGYDAAGLAGWDVDTGARLWELIPPGLADFHVGTPVDVDGSLLVATENNATRLYRFREDGTIDPRPVALNNDCAPDTCTPVVINGRAYCTAYGELFCLDLANGLATRWSAQDDSLYEHVNLLAGNDRVLAWTTNCDLLLLDAAANEFRELRRLRPFPAKKSESMSHPAIVGNRLYVRCQTELLCLDLRAEGADAGH